MILEASCPAPCETTKPEDLICFHGTVPAVFVGELSFADEHFRVKQCRPLLLLYVHSRVCNVMQCFAGSRP